MNILGLLLNEEDGQAFASLDGLGVVTDFTIKIVAAAFTLNQMPEQLLWVRKPC